MKDTHKFIRLFTGISGSRFDLAEFIEDRDNKRWIYKIQPDERPRICSCCGNEAPGRKRDTIQLRDLPMGCQAQVVKLEVERWIVDCANCGLQKEKIPFQSKFGRITKRLEEYIVDLLTTKMITVKDIARMFGLSYNLVYRIDLEMLRKKYRQGKKPDPKHIAVDEKSFKKGHSYVTIIIDVDQPPGKNVIYVAPGRKKQSLDEFFEWIGKARCKRIETMAVDLHKDYHASVKEHCPHARIVPDKFHIVKKLNETMDEVLREVIFKKTGTLAQGVDKDLKWLMRKHLTNQSDSQMPKLEGLKEYNEELFGAYILKDYFLSFFAYEPNQIQEAKRFLIHWVTEAYKTGLNAMKGFAAYIKRHQQILLNVIRTGRTSSVCEGINNKISVIKRMAYGYQKIEYFMLKIHQRCGCLGNQESN